MIILLVNISTGDCYIMQTENINNIAYNSDVYELIQFATEQELDEYIETRQLTLISDECLWQEQ